MDKSLGKEGVVIKQSSMILCAWLVWNIGYSRKNYD